jgi:hypothetical protein
MYGVRNGPIYTLDPAIFVWIWDQFPPSVLILPVAKGRDRPEPISTALETTERACLQAGGLRRRRQLRGR